MKFGVKELLFACLMLGLAAASALVLKKSHVKLEGLRADTLKKQKELADLTQSTKGIVNWDAKMAELRQAITLLESKLPQEKEMDKILKEVTQVAEANALQNKWVKTLRSERNATYSEQPIEMSLSGDFNGFYAFLLQLEKLPRITRVTHMALTKITDRDGAMQAKLTLSIFFEPDNGGSKVASAR